MYHIATYSSKKGQVVVSPKMDKQQLVHVLASVLAHDSEKNQKSLTVVRR
jgi:hypothetical protein